MPRQDVPYGGAICRLKERIAEIWDKLGEKLHSINGVEGDGAGNVEIVSGDAAVVIDNDQVGHRIEVSLDASKLPAATVSSVNGQTGAVRLDAANIPSNGNSNVQSDIDWYKQRINECFDSIATEQDDRNAADAVLQGNINSVQASIPGAAAAAVANDPTVAQLAEAVPNKLDKISSGNNLKAYTHTGGAQGETAVVNGIDANSIGLRDANGRMQAADPAAGATDKTLVTANWVSQTGDSAPNNLIHKIGNESKAGLFICPEVRPRSFYSTKHVIQTVDATPGTYYQIYKTTINTATDRNALILWNNTRKGLENQCKQCGIISIGARPTAVQIANIAGTIPTNHFAITRKADGSSTEVAFWATGQIKVYDILFESIGYNNIDTWSIGDLSSVSDFSSYDEVKYL